MATIQKREGKNGQTYRVMIRMHGYPPVQRSFKRLTDAKAWAQETELGMRRGDIRSTASEAKKRTISDVIAKYKEDILPHKAPSSQRVETTYLNHWERELGERLPNSQTRVINERSLRVARNLPSRSRAKQ